MPNFGKSKGAETAEAAAKSGRGGVEFFSVKEGETKYVRPLTDVADLVTVAIHMGVPTKDGPKRATNWPSQMSAVCQNDSAFIEGYRGGDGKPCAEDASGAVAVYEEGYGECYIHEHLAEKKGKFGESVAKTRAQTWGLFAYREAVRDNGKTIGFRDVMEKFVDADGHVHSIPKIVVASQAYNNFWGAFVSSAFMGGSICATDFSVTRTSSADYTISAGRETAEHQPGTDSWKSYEAALVLRDFSAEKVIIEQSSPKYYGRFFDPRVSNEEEGSAESASADAGAASTAADEISPDEAAATRAKMAAAFGSTQPT
jgi:hypothetical protein